MYNNNYGVWGHLGPSRGVGGAEGARNISEGARTQIMTPGPCWLSTALGSSHTCI